MQDFTSRGLNSAWLKHSKNIRLGDSNCAICLKPLYWHCRGKNVEGGWQAVKRVEQGGYVKDNCLLLCMDCFVNRTN